MNFDELLSLEQESSLVEERWEFRIAEIVEYAVPKHMREECIGDYREALRELITKRRPRWYNL
jgi:hypothetical protein